MGISATHVHTKYQFQSLLNNLDHMAHECIKNLLKLGLYSLDFFNPFKHVNQVSTSDAHRH